MATGGAPPPASDDRKLHLTCPLCLDIFTDPKMVPGCLHTFCLKCLEELVSRHCNTFPCPECRAEVDIPAAGVTSFQTNRFYHPDDLQRAREDNDCPVHANMEQDAYCVDCDTITCPKCAMKNHKLHTTKELYEAAIDAKTQLTEDLKRLQHAVSYMIGELEAEDKEQQALQDMKAAVQNTIHKRHSEIAALNNKFRDDMLTSLDATCNEIEVDLKEERQMKQNNLDQLCQLQQQAQQAVTGDRPQQLLNFAKEMKDGRGSSQTIDKLKTPQRKFVTRPELTFKVSEDVGRKRVEQFIQGNVGKVTFSINEDVQDGEQINEMMQFRAKEVTTEPTSLEVTVKELFKCGSQKDTEVFSLSQLNDGTVWVSFTQKGQEKVVPSERFDAEGTFLHSSKKTLGKVFYKAKRSRKIPVVKYNNGDSIESSSKSPALTNTFIELSYCVVSVTSDVCENTAVSEYPKYREELKTLFTISQPGPQRAFDVDGRQQLFIVLDDAKAPEKRRVHLYLRDQEKAVATYTPPSPNSQLSDVCFMTLGDQELLIVADEGTDSLHVVRVTAGGLTFLRYLVPGCPLLVQPTALNTDFEGRLWVACRGGSILTMTPIK